MELIELIIILISVIIENMNKYAKYLKYIIPLVIIYFLWKKIIKPIIKDKIKEYKRKQKLKFNEFDDFEKIEQHEIESEQLENEWKTIEEAYSEKYGILNADIIERNMKSIKLMDTTNVEEEELKEGSQIVTILEEDNTFDVGLFKKWSRNIFVFMQLGNEEELKQIKDSISDELFSRKVNQLRRFEKDGLELKRDNLIIEEIKIMDYGKWLDKAEIKVYINTKMTEYIINKTTQEVLRGKEEKINERSFIMTFQKKDGEKQVGFVSNCKNCGATIAETEFSRCKYCDSLVNPIRYNWTLIKFNVV